MPVIYDIGLSLDIDKVFQRAGWGQKSAVRPEIETVIGELLAGVWQQKLLRPAISYEVYGTTEISPRLLSLESNSVTYGSSLAWFWRHARKVAVAVCSIGSELEKRAADYLKCGQALRGTLLDAIGSAAVDSLSEEACKLIAEEASRQGLETSSPISPGMPGLPITEQWQILELAKAEKIGVSITPAGVMVPRKSVSLVIGIGPAMPKWKRAEVCARCHLKKTCPYRMPDAD